MIPFKYNIHDVDVHQNHSSDADSGWSIFLPIPGISHPLKMRFPSGKLPVCRKCKAQYKTRKYCRDNPRNHDSMPWSPTFVCLTLDNSCFVFEGQGDLHLQLKSGIFTTKILEESEALHTKYKIKKHSFSLLNKKEENCAIATTTSTKQGQPLPMCYSCKQKRYTGAYCRGKPHQFLPWSTLYFQVSCEKYTSVNHDKAQQNIPTIFDCVDRRSRTLFIQISSDTDECIAEWVEENDEETEKRPLNVSNRRRLRTTNNNEGVQITNTDNHLDLITREEECQKKTKHQHNVSALSYYHTMPQLPHNNTYTHESQTMQFPPYPNSVYWNQQPHFYPYSTINTTYPYENHNYRVPETSYQSEAHHISNFQPKYPPQPSVHPHVSFQPSVPPHAFSPIRTSETNTRCYFDNSFSHSVKEEKDKNREQNKDNGKEETDSFGFLEHCLEE